MKRTWASPARAFRRCRANKAILILPLILVLLAAFGLGSVRGNGSYQIPRWSASGSRGQGAGGDYVLQSSAGHPDTGEGSGGDYILKGGFALGGTIQEGHEIYLPLVVRNYP